MLNKGNELNAKDGETPAKYTDYVAGYLDKGYEASYKEMAVMTYWERPTPGYMMPYQWAYIVDDIDNVPADAKVQLPANLKNYVYNKDMDDEALVLTDTENRNWIDDMYTFLKESKLNFEDDETGGDGSGREEIDYKTLEKLYWDKLVKAFSTSIDEYYCAATPEKRFAAITKACSNYNPKFEAAYPDVCEKFRAAINEYNALIKAANNNLESATDIAASAFPSSNTTYGQLNSLLKLCKTAAGGEKS